jgi:acetyl esterase/lipase
MRRWIRIITWVAIGLGSIFCLGFGLLAVRYQSHVDEEPEIALTPSLVDVSYCSPGGVPQRLDLYFPSTPGPWHVLVYVHGGSFTAGDKRKGSGLIDIPRMVEQGFAVAAVNYRLMPEYPFPAGLEDVKCARRTRYLRMA